MGDIEFSTNYPFNSDEDNSARWPPSTVNVPKEWCPLTTGFPVQILMILSSPLLLMIFLLAR